MSEAMFHEIDLLNVKTYIKAVLRFLLQFDL